MTRTRSEYRLTPIVADHPTAPIVTRRVRDSDRDQLAALMLDGYRGTIDDEGEDLDDALAAVDQYLARMEAEHSVVVTVDDVVVAMALVGEYEGLHYVDPVVVEPTHKRAGVGRNAVRVVLASLARAGVTEAGATITDGNTPSERLFLGLGFLRRGAWPRPAVRPR
jgi:L-amino acid N-acyltransferase YncA